MNAYKRFSYYYDEVVERLDYRTWFNFIMPYLHYNDKVLDLACGTGTLCMMLKLKEFNVSGLDLSKEIIEIAKEKAKVNHLHIPYYNEDMTNFHLDEKFNCITCFFDSINFLPKKEDVLNLMKCVYEHLEDGGYFICDIFSKALFDEYKNNVLEEDYDFFQVKWITKTRDERTLLHDITIKENDNYYHEYYNEYLYSIDDLKHDGLKLIQKCGDFNEDLEDEDERILLVFKKEKIEG